MLGQINPEIWKLYEAILFNLGLSGESDVQAAIRKHNMVIALVTQKFLGGEVIKTTYQDSPYYWNLLEDDSKIDMAPGHECKNGLEPIITTGEPIGLKSYPLKVRKLYLSVLFYLNRLEEMENDKSEPNTSQDS